MSSKRDLGGDLRRWINAEAENASTEQRCSMYATLARRLDAHPAMGHAWAEIAKHGGDALDVLDMVEFAWRSALIEESRPTAGEEKVRYRKVLKAIEALQAAVDEACMPSVSMSGSRAGKRLGADAFYWRRQNAEFQPFPHDAHGRGLCLEEVLDHARQLAGFYQARPHPRTVDRKRNQFRLRAFLVRLSRNFESEFGGKLYGTLAHIASAVFEEDISKEQVVSILVGL